MKTKKVKTYTTDNIAEYKAKNLILNPAHNKDYNNADELLKDWDNNTDFIIENNDNKNEYINKKEFYLNPDFSNVQYIHFKYFQSTKRKVIKPSISYSEYSV